MLLIGYFERIDSELRDVCLAVFGLSCHCASFLALEWKSEHRTIRRCLGYGIDFRWKFTNLYLDGS